MKLVESIMTRNPCYTAGRKITVKGLMLHSVGCPQPKASAFINSWNSPSHGSSCVHGFIDGNDGTVYQTLPWNHRGWHCGSGNKGSGNNTQRERTLLTSPYFRLIRQTDDFFEVQSRCTKHCWIVQKLSYDRYPVRIYHKHTKGTAYYHRHGHANTVSSAVRQIKSHDVWQLNGRRAMA